MSIDAVLTLLAILLLASYSITRSVLYPPVLFCGIWLFDLSLYRLDLIPTDPLHPYTLGVIAAGAVIFSLGSGLAMLVPRGLIAPRFILSRFPPRNQIIKTLLIFFLSWGLPLLFLAVPRLAAGSGVAGRSAAAKFHSHIPQADQFSGPDFCGKLRAANVYALANNISLVDATNFSGTQACSVDPFHSLAATLSTIKLTVHLPAADIQTTVPWVINNSGLNIIGQGPASTWIDYTGAPGAPAVISTVGSGAGNVQNNQISEVSIIGGNSNVTDGLFYTYAHHWKIEDVDVWGVIECGIHTAFAVTPTMIRPRISGNDASLYGYLTGRSVPIHGLCLDGVSKVGQTTDGTISDAAAEGVKESGWFLPSANSMTFTSGTSENNGSGIRLNAGSSYNSFIGADLESNSANSAGVDINDGGASNYFRNVISASPCSSCSSILMTGYWSVLEGGYFVTNPSGPGVNWWNHEGNVIESALVVNGGISSRTTRNNSGFQLVTGPGCSIRAGAIGNSCLSSTITFPVEETDSNAKVVCTLTGGHGVNVLGNLTALNHSGFAIEEIAMSATAAGGGTISCMVGHN